MSYATTTGHPFLSAPYYSPPPHYTSLAHAHSVAPSSRQDAAAKKRPKYTRSKTGCMTCRVKKIKCDETKPTCQRCAHGQRDCTWPDGVPARKKNTPKKEPSERPSTAGSSGMSESPTPPIRDPTPPKRVAADVGLPPLVSRRQNDSYFQLHPMTNDADPGRRQPGTNDRIANHGYSFHSTPSASLLPLIPDVSSYPSHHRYDHDYPSNRIAATHHLPALNGIRPMSHHQSMSQWTQPIMPPMDHMNPYFHGLQERNLVGHTSHNDQHIRYQ